MSRVLVIKNADFSANKLTTITFGDVPCTGLTLQSTAQITTVDGSVSLTATKVPSNTTDILTWSSSNSNVATVDGGVVTAVGEGMATITAMCGTQTAECTVTVAYTKTFAPTGILTVNTNGTTAIYDFAKLTSSGLRPIAIGITSGAYPAYGASTVTADSPFYSLYPIPIPAGCKQIKVTSANIAPLIVYYNRDVKSAHTALTRDCAKVLDGECTNGGTPWSISSWPYGGKTFTVPENANIDGYTLSFNCNSADVHDNFDLSDVTIEYLFE